MTDFGRTQALDPNRTQMGAPPVLDPNRTIMTPGPAFDRTVTLKPLMCPVCKSMNPPGLIYCSDCGLIFSLALEGDAFGAPSVQLPVLVETGGREHKLRPGTLVVGRQGDIAIEDTRMSRRHAQIDSTPTTATIEDLGSTNGTLVNGQRLSAGEKKSLKQNDVVSLGGCELRFMMPGEASKTLAPMSGRTAAISAAPTASDSLLWISWGGAETPVSPGSHTFGRRDGNGIVIADPYVSGRHGEIQAGEDGIFITDIGSTNGTFVNDARLAPNQRTRLVAGDQVRLGELKLELRFKGA